MDFSPADRDPHRAGPLVRPRRRAPASGGSICAYGMRTALGEPHTSGGMGQSVVACCRGGAAANAGLRAVRLMGTVKPMPMKGKAAHWKRQAMRAILLPYRITEPVAAIRPRKWAHKPRYRNSQIESGLRNTLDRHPLGIARPFAPSCSASSYPAREKQAFRE